MGPGRLRSSLSRARRAVVAMLVVTVAWGLTADRAAAQTPTLTPALGTATLAEETPAVTDITVTATLGIPWRSEGFPWSHARSSALRRFYPVPGGNPDLKSSLGLRPTLQTAWTKAVVGALE